MTFEFFLPHSGTCKNIHLNITDKQQNKIYRFRTSLQILEKDWDTIKQRPTNIYLKKYKKLNAKLDGLKKEVAEYIRVKRSGKSQVKQREIAKTIKWICSSNKVSKEHVNYPENSFLYYMQWYISIKKGLICNSTIKRYKVFFHLLERFEGFLCKKLYLEDINIDFIKNFMFFGKEEEYSDNTIVRTIHFVKTILNFAERKGVRTHVRELEIRREKQHCELATLSEREILQINSTIVSDEMQYAKDWLLISCYTGQRFSDFMRFSKEQLINVNNKICIGFTQRKTHKKILLPLHPVVMNILKRYDGNFPPSLDMRQYNCSIKEIAKQAQLKGLIKAKKRVGHRVKCYNMEKWEVLSSHIGRRSFATNFYGKIPTPLLMDATGHSTEQMFLRYINPLDENRILSLSSYFDRVYKDRMVV